MKITKTYERGYIFLKNLPLDLGIISFLDRELDSRQQYHWHQSAGASPYPGICKHLCV